jgi:hypothetical protein
MAAWGSFRGLVHFQGAQRAELYRNTNTNTNNQITTHNRTTACRIALPSSGGLRGGSGRIRSRLTTPKSGHWHHPASPAPPLACAAPCSLSAPFAAPPAADPDPETESESGCNKRNTEQRLQQAEHAWNIIRRYGPRKLSQTKVRQPRPEQSHITSAATPRAPRCSVLIISAGTTVLLSAIACCAVHAHDTRHAARSSSWPDEDRRAMPASDGPARGRIDE